ncbi:MAG: GNAT family N-acetyltransferase [Candidatus Bathyarchaeia archaeon]
MFVAVLYNQPQPLPYGEEKDKISEDAVLEEVSDVQQALQNLGHQAILMPLTNDVPKLVKELSSTPLDCVFNLCEGAYGCSVHEMNVPSILELLRIPYTGSPSMALGCCLDKATAKRILIGAGLPTPSFTVAQTSVMPEKIPSYPLIVKPIREDGGRGVSRESVVYDEAALKERIRYVWEKYRQPALVERFIEGRELNVSLIGNSSPETLAISEVEFSGLQDGSPRILTYDGKWLEESREYAWTPVTCPASVEDSLRGRLEEISKKAFQILGCMGYARIDFRVDLKGRPYLIDVNPNPDISRKAGFANSAEKAGVPYPQLIQRIMDLAIERHSTLKPIQFVKIRKMVETDVPIVLNLLDMIPAFKRMEVTVAREVIEAYVKKPEGGDYSIYIAEHPESQVVGYVCFGPTPLTEGTYDIYWVAVEPRLHGQGVGGKLLRFAEQLIRSRGGRKIIVETSSKEEYEAARNLYEAHGFKEVAKISSFYAKGDDKIIYEKNLSNNN